MKAGHKRRRGRQRSVLHVEQILTWADEFHSRRGRWPKKDDGRIAGTVDEKWRNIDNALRYGLRGLPGSWSLAQLLNDYRNVRNVADLPRYRVKQILAWAEAHYERTGLWPTPKSGPVVEAPGESWMAVHRALFSGGRGMRAGMSLAKLLHRYRRVRVKHRRLRPFNVEDVLAWADAHHRRTGHWPKEESGSIPEAPGETWCKVQNAMREGRRGFRAGSSLSLLLAEHRGVRNHLALAPLTIKEILKWADAYYARHARWPSKDSGLVEDAPGETWTAVHVALTHGRRGLEGGSSLAQLLAEYREVRNRGNLSELSLSVILAWADAHHARSGRWPTQASGPILDATGETWLAVDKAARNGGRGLRGGSSLAKILRKHRSVQPKHRRQPPLHVQTILSWADAYHRRTGRWPNQNSGPIPEAPGETWCKINTALREGKRELDSSQTIGKLLAEQRGVRNVHAIKPLTIDQILAWADAYFGRHNRWPGRASGAVDGEPGENWCSVDNALRHGLRGQRGGSSLKRLLADRRSIG